MTPLWLPSHIDPQTHAPRILLPTDPRTHLKRRRTPSRRIQRGMISPALLGVVAARARTAGGGGGTPTLIFSSANNSGFTLSNTDHTASGGQANYTVVSTPSSSASTKRYMEFNLDAVALGSMYFGLKVGATTTFGSRYCVWNGNGICFSNTGSTNVTAFAAGNVGQIAYDPVTGKAWLGRNNTWFVSGDPAAGTGNIVNFTAADELYFVLQRDNNSGSTVTVTIASTYTYSPPSGFFAW